MNERTINAVEQHRSLFGMPCNSGGQYSEFRTQEIVDAVLSYGHPYVRTVVNEGNAESGPYSNLYFGMRWGQVFVEMSPSGSVYLERRNGHDDWGYNAMSRIICPNWVPGIYIETWREVVRGVMRAIREVYYRDGIETVESLKELSSV